MRQTSIILWAMLCASWTSTAHAAFVTCEDARQYGENSARLFVGQSFARIDCDGALRDRVHMALDRVLARQVLRTNDSDAEKVCFYQGLFTGLRAQLLTEYAACPDDERFTCLPRDSLASHAGSLLGALTLSLRDPSSLPSADLLVLFDVASEDEPLSPCEAACSLSCRSALLASVSPLGLASFAGSLEALGQLLCGD